MGQPVDPTGTDELLADWRVRAAGRDDGVPRQRDGLAYINHMHKIGRKMWLTAEKTGENITNGTGVHEVECNTAYDFDLQEALFLPTPWS